MLGVGRLPPLSALPISQRSVAGFSACFFVLSPSQSRHTHFLISRIRSRGSIDPLPLGRCVSCFFAQKKHSDGGELLLEGEGFVDFDIDVDGEYDDDDLINDEDDDGDDEDDDIVLGIDEMDAWLRREPLGFGEGKVYGTLIEDKLLEEIEQSRKAQLANINKLKNHSAERNKNKVEKEPSIVASEMHVRISQLPKKKNILRDLNAAFKGVSGIINISPVVSGNKKTKDPVCKGLAFVDFKSLKDANRFVRMFSGQNIAFGRIEKQIKCELLNSSTVETFNTEGYKYASVGEVNPLSHLHDDDENDGLEESLISNDEYTTGTFELLDHEGSESTGLKAKPLAVISSSRLEDDEPITAKTKPAMRKKTNKITVAKIPKAAKRLKVREKALLADVFSRYGSKVASASKERS